MKKNRDPGVKIRWFTHKDHGTRAAKGGPHTLAPLMNSLSRGMLFSQRDNVRVQVEFL